MADKKISALTSATTPLAGTEVLPIVQGGATVKVAVSDLTAGRTVTASQVNVVVAGASTSTLYLDSKAPAFDGGWNYIDSVNVSNGSNDLVIQSRSVYVTSEKFRFKAAGDFNVGVGNLVIGTSGKGIDFSANTPAAGMTSQLLNWYEEGTWTPVATSASGAITAYTSSATYTRVGRLVYVDGVIVTTTIGTAGGKLNIAGLPFTVASYYQSGLVNEVVNTGTYYVVSAVPSSTTATIQTMANGAIAWQDGSNFQFSFTYRI